LHGASNTMTQTGMVMGTPQYLSPEQALGKTVDIRSDLYATGCLLYELLTLRPPFTGETPLSVVYQHVQDEASLPSEVSDVVPPELDGLVMRALAKDPDDRFQSAEEMRGLAQYGLQMLHEQGGHTGGMWNTGPIAHSGGSTPAMGVPGVGARQHPAHGETSQLAPPLLMGRPDRDDGGFEGGPNDRRGGGGIKYAFLAFLAVMAVAAGIYYAATYNANDGNTDVKPDSSTSEPKDKESTQEPSETPTETEEEPSTGDTGDVTPSETPSQTKPSETETTPSQEPTDSPTETDSGGNEQGGGSGGPTDTPSETPTDATAGNDQGGGDNGGPGGEGGADD
ncbi:MAG TPA: serine/threonine protein kinase, partial [Streptomyces sp.]|nr:serine/threonine protein kinase [Streptomyces sp.]